MESSGSEKAMGHTLLIMKKLVIVEHRAKELANRMWNDMSIYSYGMEINARVINTTFFEHIRFLRWLHIPYARCVDIITRKTCALWTTGMPKFLPPTAPLSEKHNACGTVYFFGWLFRNPIGIEKYRSALLKKFAPSKSARKKINEIIKPLKNKNIRIGIHLRQRPFKGFENGEFLILPARVKNIIDEYLLENSLNTEEVALVMASDANEKTNLFLLSECDVIIGDNSTFSNLAAWLGNIPHIVITEGPVDWSYYKGKTSYFENKYATFTHGSLFYP